MSSLESGEQQTSLSNARSGWLVDNFSSHALCNIWRQAGRPLVCTIRVIAVGLGIHPRVSRSLLADRSMEEDESGEYSLDKGLWLENDIATHGGEGGRRLK